MSSLKKKVLGCWTGSWKNATQNPVNGEGPCNPSADRAACIFQGIPPPSAKLASLPHVPELVCFWLVSWRAGRADKLAILWESGWTQGDVVASESTSHAATTCSDNMSVEGRCLGRRQSQQGLFGRPFWTTLSPMPVGVFCHGFEDAHVSKSCLGGTPNLARLGHQLTSRPKDHHRHPNISHSQHSPPDPSSQPATSLPQINPSPP